MTKLLERAVAKVRDLPDEEQDALAIALLSMADTSNPLAEMDENTRGAIQEGLAQARRGEFISDEEVKALWKFRHTPRARGDLEAILEHLEDEADKVRAASRGPLRKSSN